MVDLAREAFSTNNFGLAAEIYERTIREKGPTSELLLGLADSLARKGMFAKAFQSYTNAYRFGKVTPEKLGHLVAGLIDTVKQDTTTRRNLVVKKSMFLCGVCRGLLDDPVTLPCGHTFCRTCIEKDQCKTCERCNVAHYRLNVRHLSSTVVLTNLVEKWFPKAHLVSRLKRKGNEYFSAGDYKNAVNMYSQALNISNTDHLLLSNRSHSYALMDQFVNALLDAEKVVLLHPDWPKGYFRKGCALFGLGRYEDAVVSYLQCLALDQKVSTAKEFLSKALDRMLSVLPPDDPKTYVVQQQMKSSLLRTLIENNFSQSILPNITQSLSDMTFCVKDTLSLAEQFPVEQLPEVFVTSSRNDLQIVELKQQRDCLKHSQFQENSSQDFVNCNLKCSNTLANQAHEDNCNKQNSMSESHSPSSRKRQRNPSTNHCSVSPYQSSPQKIFKMDGVCSVAAITSPTLIATTKPTNLLCASDQDPLKPEQLHIEDLECGLCYRLFFEPVTTPCGHTFCRQCLDRSLDHTVSCPMCKGNLAEYLAERRHAVTEAIQCIIETFFKEAYAERCKISEEEMTDLIRMGSGQQSDIAVFVCILAFPTIPCPLHVFEPRYRLMIRQCMESGTRQFGMCMSTGDNDDDFSDYGCMLEIRDVQYFPDGRSVVDTIGGRRFKVLSRGKRDGYNTATVAFISDKQMDAAELNDANSMQTEIHAMVKNWFMNLPTLHRARISQHFGDLPDIESHAHPTPNGAKWAWWAVAVLPIDRHVQMALLAMSSFQERLVALKKVLVYMNRRGTR